MNKLTALFGLGILLSAIPAFAQVSEEEVQALRAQIELLTRRLDQLEQQNAQPAPAASNETTARVDAMDAELDAVQEQVAAMSWAERL